MIPVGPLANALTADRTKLGLYANDVFFRESDRTFACLDPAVRDAILATTSFMLFKPEAIVGRRIEPALRHLAEAGFEPLGALSLPFDRYALRAMWWYQLNAAPLSVIRVVEMMIAETEFLFVGLRDRRARPGCPADASGARRLSDLKGSSRDIGKGMGLLRDALECTTQAINFIHAPDEPADLVRELGVLFNEQDRSSAIAVLSGDTDPGEVTRLTSRAYTLHQPHPLRLDDAVKSLQDTGGDRHPQAVGEVLAAIATDAPEETLLRLIDWLDTVELPLTRWDRIVLASHLVGEERAEVHPMIGPPPGVRAQHRRAEVLARQARTGASAR